MGNGISEEELIKAQLGVDNNGEKSDEDPAQDDDPEDLRRTHIEELGEVWGIDEDVAEAIIDCNNDHLLDQNMVIFEDGTVESAVDEDGVKSILKSYFLRDGGVVLSEDAAEIAYVFINGDLYNYSLDIRLLRCPDELEPKSGTEPMLEPGPGFNPENFGVHP